MANSVTKISDHKEKNDVDIAWNQVTEALNVVLTLAKVQPKCLPRTGRHMKVALNTLFDTLRIYDIMRGQK